MSTSRTEGSLSPGPTREAHDQPLVAALVARLCQLSSEGVADPSSTLAPLELAAPDGEVARRVARAFLLLVAGVVLLVDHDQFQARHRSEHRHARAEHDARRAAVRGQPAFQALRMGHAAVQRRHCTVAGAEALDEACLQLRREIDLGHHHQRLRLRVARQQALHGVQVHLGLAAAGAAEQQEGPALRLRTRPGRRVAPAVSATGARIRMAPRLRRRPVALQPPGQLDRAQVAQLRRQRRERNFAQARAGSSAQRTRPGRRQASSSGGRPSRTAGDRLECDASGSPRRRPAAPSQTTPSTSRRPSGTRTSVPGASGSSLT